MFGPHVSPVKVRKNYALTLVRSEFDQILFAVAKKGSLKIVLFTQM